MQTNTFESPSAAAEDASVMMQAPRRVRVGIADYAVVDEHAVLSTSGLGSCLGIALFDETAGVAGLLHAMLPEADSDVTSPAKFVDSGLETVVTEMARQGADPETIAAKMAGGSTMLDLTQTEAGSIGDRNIDAARTAFDASDITLVSEDVGGEYGRSLLFDSDTYDLAVKTAYKGDAVI